MFDSFFCPGFHVSIMMFSQTPSDFRHHHKVEITVVITSTHRDDHVRRRRHPHLMAGNRQLPPQAAEISLRRGARRPLRLIPGPEGGLQGFSGPAPGSQKHRSAHQPGSMADECEPADRERMTGQSTAAGWGPLDNIVVCFGSSTRSSTITTCSHERKAGIVYHDPGYR